MMCASTTSPQLWTGGSWGGGQCCCCGTSCDCGLQYCGMLWLPAGLAQSDTALAKLHAQTVIALARMFWSLLQVYHSTCPCPPRCVPGVHAVLLLLLGCDCVHVQRRELCSSSILACMCPVAADCPYTHPAHDVSCRMVLYELRASAIRALASQVGSHAVYAAPGPRPKALAAALDAQRLAQAVGTNGAEYVRSTACACPSQAWSEDMRVLADAVHSEIIELAGRLMSEMAGYSTQICEGG